MFVPQRGEMDRILDEVRDALVDDFAHTITLLNDRNYEDAALYLYALGQSLSILSSGVAAEALARRLEGKGLTDSE